VLPGLVGTLQATEAIKLLGGLGSPLIGRLLHLDALSMRHREIRLRRDPACALCGDAPTLTELPDYPLTCAAETIGPSLTVAEFATLRANRAPYTLLDVREPDEVAAARFPESIAIPLGQLSARRGEIPNAPRPLIVHCKAGGRSARALALLAEYEVSGEHLNLVGGLDAWIAEQGPPS
jgi:adenylyltransferase/sulfurtransferase